MTTSGRASLTTRGENGDDGADGASPADAPVKGSPWYKRRAWLVSVALILVVGVTVLTDLPQHSSRSSQIADDTTVMTQVNTDIGPCSHALGESFTIYRDLRAHTFTPAQSGQVPGLLRDDRAACSFTDDSIYQLSTIDVPASVSGRDVRQVVSTVILWATSDALSAIEQIQALDSDPADGAAKQLLDHQEQLLVQDRSLAESQLGAADALLQAKLPALRLTQVPTAAS
jgi:hypothetical protein